MHFFFQLVFNQALSKLAEEKDQIIFEFEKKLNELTRQNQKVEGKFQSADFIWFPFFVEGPN